LNASPSFIEIVATPEKGVVAAPIFSVGNDELIHIHSTLADKILLRVRVEIMLGIVRVQKVITFSLVKGAKLIELPDLWKFSQQRVGANGLCNHTVVFK
jgi:hypothetical protein